MADMHLTLAEDRTTAVIWGMSGTAVAMGAAAEVLPVDRIADRLMQLAKGMGAA